MNWRNIAQSQWDTRLDTRETVNHMHAYLGVVTNGIIHYLQTGEITLTRKTPLHKVIVGNVNLWEAWL